MTTHGSATSREQKPHVNQTTRTATVINALKRRAQAVLNDESIDAQSRAIIRYGLETNDPWLAELLRRADAGERIADTLDFSQPPKNNDDGPSQGKIEALVESSAEPVMNLPQHCSCSWELLSTPLSPGHSRTR